MVKHTVIAALLLAGISCGSNVTPTSPTPTTATVVSLTLTAAAPGGAGFQMNARALMSDGASLDVTTLATWESSNPSLATISTVGIVTVIGGGVVDFRATYRSTAASLRVSTTQSRFTISGRVSPVYPNFPRHISGARVEILTGPNAGAFTLTDINGDYSFAGLSPGLISMRAATSGFSAWSLANLSFASDTSIDPVLFPIPPTNESGQAATAQCMDSSWTWVRTSDRACGAHLGVAWAVCPGPICDAIGSIR